MTNSKKVLAPDAGRSVNWVHVILAVLGFLVINATLNALSGVRLVLATILCAYLPTYFDGSEFTPEGRPWPAIEKSKAICR